MDQVSQRDLRILTAIAERKDVTQRGLSESLGIALGLTNLYLKRLARKGYVKLTTIPPRRIKYLLTPRGVAAKTRLTYEYMAFSLALYRETRRTLREAVRPLIGDGSKRFALYGRGEAAELAYLTLREFGLQPIGLYGEEGDVGVLDLPTRRLRDLAGDGADHVVVAAFDAPARHARLLVEHGIPRRRLIFLVNGKGSA